MTAGKQSPAVFFAGFHLTPMCSGDDTGAWRLTPS